MLLIWRYVSKRMIQTVLAFFIFSFICFLLIRQLPGSIAYAIYGANAQRLTNEELLRIEQAVLGEKSLVTQYIEWFTQLFKGNWGFSFSQQQDVLQLIQQQYVYTIVIVVLAMILANVLIACVLLLLHHWKHRVVRAVIEGVFLITMIVPGFWVGFLLLWLFAVKLPLFPLYGIGNGQLLSLLYHALLPSVTLALPAVFYGVKLMQNQLIIIQQQPFVEQLKLRRISKWRLVRHMLPHLGLVLLQLNGVLVTGFIGGTIAVETVFSIPGLGKLTVEATKLHDYPTLLMIILLGLACVLIVQLLIDLMSCSLDPRVYKSLKD